MMLCRGLSCKKGGQSLTTWPWKNQAFQSLGFPCNTEGDLFLRVLRKTVAPSRHWYTASTLHTPRPRGNFLELWQSRPSTTGRVAMGVVSLEHSYPAPVHHFRSIILTEVAESWKRPCVRHSPALPGKDHHYLCLSLKQGYKSSLRTSALMGCSRVSLCFRKLETELECVYLLGLSQ